MSDFPKTLNTVRSIPQAVEIAHKRAEHCKHLATVARSFGLDVTWQKVNYNYTTWVRWAEGRLATGYLMKLTGVKQYRDLPETE